MVYQYTNEIQYFYYNLPGAPTTLELNAVFLLNNLIIVKLVKLI